MCALVTLCVHTELFTIGHVVCVDQDLVRLHITCCKTAAHSNEENVRDQG